MAKISNNYFPTKNIGYNIQTAVGDFTNGCVSLNFLSSLSSKL